MEIPKGRKETVYTFIAAFGSKILTYLLLLALANLFVKEVYGKAAFVISVFDLSIFLGTIGVPHILAPWISKKRDVRSVFYSLLGVSLIFMIVGIFIALKYIWILPIVLVYPILFLRNLAGAHLHANFKYHIMQAAGALYILVTMIFVLILKQYQNAGIVGAYALGYIASTIFVIIFTKKELKILFSKFQIKLPTLKSYLKKSVISAVLFLSFLFLKWIDTSILGILSTFQSVAVYSVAAPIANAVSIVSVPFSMYLLSRIPKVKSKVESLKILKTGLRISFILTLLVLILINSISPLIVKIFFPKYVGIEIYIMILSVGMLFFSLYGPIYAYVSGLLKPMIGFASIVTAAVLNIALDIILIPKFDVYGIVVATTLAHLTAFTMLFKKLKIIKAFFPAYLAALFIIASYYLNYYGLLMIVLAIPFALLTKLFTKSDFEIMKSTFFSMVKLK